ncbi:DUF1826 domain-containing protein [Vreelandella populi]|uniref:DUF1826 domain-containing protein n=1 Tax=Vreelandella populi TaxID=2498858 RepID=A0A3S1E9K8_9GAMM|nr:DUF1826 domain-containing protein [Halomonas populi]RUR37793.1 DUF1826 domain-containing protein [Halomonas populi]RUR48702.1 DUF1826 domain-containing protein [Halomonas populi]
MTATASSTALLPLHAALGTDISVLPRIFEDAINIAVMQRRLPADVALSAKAQYQIERPWQFSWLGAPDERLVAELKRRAPQPEAADALIDDIVSVAQAVAYLFDTQTVGIRLRVLTEAMCPRFHCDNLPVRLVTTYLGPDSEWLPEEAVNRDGLGAPHPDRPEIVLNPDAVQMLKAGDIALIKGSGWEGSEHSALVHRSPSLSPGQKRLLLTIDPA